jgi:hypothetical protein
MKDFLVKLIVAFVCISNNFVFANDLDDFDALNLANQTSGNTNSSKADSNIFIEAATGQTLVRGSTNYQANQRISGDLQFGTELTKNLRAFISDRLDVDGPSTFPGNNSSNSIYVQNSNAINTLREGYLTWQPNQNALLDVGRVNVVNGVGTGYNPTDYFKVGALRSIVTINPYSLKENRQGSVMIRGQQLWDTGAFSLIYSPKVSSQTNNSAFSLDLGATNNQNSVLAQLTQKISEGFSPQFLVYQSGQSSPQFGLNLTGLVDDSTTAYLEWSGGRTASLLGQSINQQGYQYPLDIKFNNQVSSGLTYTTKNKISITGEFEFNSAGLNNPDWANLGPTSPFAYETYRKYLQVQQASPTKSGAFLYVKWDDFLIKNLNLSSMLRQDLVDSSHQFWIESRYRFTESEVALQFQNNVGSTWSNYGAIPQSQIVQLLFRCYL